MKKFNKTPFAAAMGTAVLSTLSVTAAHAEANPFAMTDMNSGYMQLAAADTAKSGMKEGACGEGKCGGSMMKSAPKTVEGACAGNKPAAKPAAKAADKATEGKCGEGMCGAMMEGGKMKKGMEAACGAMMKGKEGACGAMQKGAGQEKVSPKDAAGE